MEHMWIWAGKYFGYRQGQLLFTDRGVCAGRFNENFEAYDKHGWYLGEIGAPGRLIINRAKKSRRGTPAPAMRSRPILRRDDTQRLPPREGFQDFPESDEFS